MLLERNSQLAALRHELDEAVAGRGRLVAVAGEAGAGKTALVEAFVAGAGTRARVLRAACEDLSIPDPLGPLYDLAQSAGWPMPRLAQGEGGRLPLFAEARDVFKGPPPGLLVIEDLHWADDATLDFVRYLGRRIANSAIMLLLTARNDESEGQKRLRRALGDVPLANVTRIDVPLLSEAAVTELARVTGQDSGPIYRASAGNAFFVTELLRAGATRDLPQSVRDATLARAERLSPDQRSALDAVSVFPRRAEADVLRRVLAGGDELLAACVAAGMLEPSGDGYAFRHEIARRTVEAALPLHRRQALNAQVLAALRLLPDVPAARLAHHAVEARHAEAVRELSPKAAHEASRMGAHREAAGHYEAMLQLAEGFTLDEQAQINSRLAFECHLIGRIGDAVKAQKRARDLYGRLGNRLREGDALRWLSRLSYLNGRRHDADSYGAEAIAMLEAEPPGAELAMAYSNLSQLAMLEDEHEKSIREGKSAIALGEVLGRPDIVSHALNNVGTSRVWSDHQQGRVDLRRSLELALAHNFQEHAARTYTNFGCFEFSALEFGPARELFETGITYCIDRDLDTWRCYMQGWLAETLLNQGSWDEAADKAAEIVAADNVSPLMRYMSVMTVARLRLRRGDPELEPLLAELRAFTVSNGEVQRLAPWATLLAERAWLGLGDRAEALKAIDCAQSLIHSHHQFGELLVWRRRLDPSYVPGDAIGLAEPYAAELAGDWRRAARLWGEIGAPFERAMALLSGDESGKREALQLFEALGAPPVATKVRTMMRRSGISNIANGPRAATRANVLGLTQREMEVLKLVDRGLSSKRIAVELDISPKTVDHHVAAMMEKLGAHTRVEASAVARDAGLL
jgi:predicted ATPase